MAMIKPLKIPAFSFGKKETAPEAAPDLNLHGHLDDLLTGLSRETDVPGGSDGSWEEPGEEESLPGSPDIRGDPLQEPPPSTRRLPSFISRPAKPKAVPPRPGGSGTAAPARSALTVRLPFLARLASLFSPEEEPQLTSHAFFVGDTGDPSLDGSLKDVCITYAVDPPYQFVHIEYDREARALSYGVVEPQLSEDEAHYLQHIKKAFEKMIGTDIGLLSAEHREAYLRERFLSIVAILGFKFAEEQKERIYFHLRREYIGYGRIDTLMKDRYIEDISCNGANMDLYVQHRIYGPVRTNVRFGDLELNNFVLKLAQISGRTSRSCSRSATSPSPTGAAAT
jgi:hypothetical protein